MAKLTLMRSVKCDTLYLVGVFKNLDTKNKVIFVDEDGYITYGTEEYLENNFVAVANEYKFTIKR